MVRMNACSERGSHTHWSLRRNTVRAVRRCFVLRTRPQAPASPPALWRPSISLCSPVALADPLLELRTDMVSILTSRALRCVWI